jgi:hypothetical protein
VYQTYIVYLNYHKCYKLKVCFTETKEGVTVQVLAEHKINGCDYETENFFDGCNPIFKNEHDVLFKVPSFAIPDLMSWIETRAGEEKFSIADY